MKTKKRNFRYDRLIIFIAIILIIIFIIYFSILGIIKIFKALFPKSPEIAEDIRVIEDYNKLLPSIQVSVPEAQEYTVTHLIYDDNTKAIGSNINSTYGIVYCVDDRQVLGRKSSQERMYPASMTKVMSLIVAVENILDLNDTFEMTFEIINPLYLQNATVTGLSSGETVPLIDLLYGIILPSGADATDAIAQYICGSQDEFVKLMNKKAEELGLIDTHLQTQADFTTQITIPRHTIWHLFLTMRYIMRLVGRFFQPTNTQLLQQSNIQTELTFTVLCSTRSEATR